MRGRGLFMLIMRVRIFRSLEANVLPTESPLQRRVEARGIGLVSSWGKFTMRLHATSKCCLVAARSGIASGWDEVDEVGGGATSRGCSWD